MQVFVSLDTCLGFEGGSSFSSEEEELLVEQQQQQLPLSLAVAVAAG